MSEPTTALTIRPEVPCSKQIAEIQVTSSCIMARLRDREERFRAVMHQLGYRWQPPAWIKTITQFTGTLDDRLVELAATLLSAGYIIEFPRPDLVERVAQSAYAPEHHRWVTRQAGTGWFQIRWPRNEDYYQRARRIHGSRYDGAGVVIAPQESYAEVLDFAELHGFQLSAGAQEVAAAAQQRYEAMILVVPKKQARAKSETAVAPEIDPELLDVDDDDRAA